MQPDEYRVCVTGGYPMRNDGTPYEAEAIVYIWGGRTVARFVASGGRASGGARGVVEHRAQAWIRADDATRAKMQESEALLGATRHSRWRRWWADA